MPITLDIGGEGRHRHALNLNRSSLKTLGPQRGQPIPNLIVGRADAIPLSDRSVDRILVERTPLPPAALSEIARVIAPDGVIVLTHVPLVDADRHALARRMLGGQARIRLRILGGQSVQETRIELSARDAATVTS